MLSPSQLNPSLHAAAQHLLAELRRLQPGLATEAQTLVVLLDAVTVQTGNLLVQQAAPAEVVTCWTDDDVLIALRGGGLTHAVSVRALTRALFYTSPDGQHLHPASRDHLQGQGDAVDVLLRLALTPGWTDLLSLTVERAARVFLLMAERGLELQAAEVLAQQEMADLAGQVRVTGWSRGEVNSAPDR